MPFEARGALTRKLEVRAWRRVAVEFVEATLSTDNKPTIAVVRQHLAEMEQLRTDASAAFDDATNKEPDEEDDPSVLALSAAAVTSCREDCA